MVDEPKHEHEQKSEATRAEADDGNSIVLAYPSRFLRDRDDFLNDDTE
jgi:hypothetical protein